MDPRRLSIRPLLAYYLGGTPLFGAAGAWLVGYARDVRVQGVEELAPAPELAHAPLLLQVEVPDPPGVPDELIRALGITVETELVFTGDLVQTIDRVARERETRAVLSLRPVKTVSRILVALKDAGQVDEAAGYAVRVAGATGARVTITHPPVADESLAATLRGRFQRAGVRPADTTIEPSERNGGAAIRILEAAEDADLIVVGETHPAEEEDTFGGVNETVTRKADVPVLLVRVRGSRDQD